MLKFLLGALIFFLPTQLGYHFWLAPAYVWGIRVDFLSPTFFLTDVIVFLIAVFYEAKKHWLEQWVSFFKKKPASFLIILFLALNIFLSSRRIVAGYRFLKLAEFIFLIYFFQHEFKEKWRLPLFWANFYTCLIAWGQFFKEASLGKWFWWLGERSFNLATNGIARAQIGSRLFLRPYATFSHPNSLAGFLLASILLLWPLRNNLSAGKRRFFDLAMVFFSLTLFLTFSWAAYLAILFLFIFIIFKERKIKAGFLVLLLLIAVVLQSIKVGLIERRSIDERLFLADNALQLVKAHPIFGVGLGNFIPAQLELSFLRGHDNFLQPVHNIYLLVASETGLTGLIIFMVMVVYLIKKLIKNLSSSFILYTLYVILFLGLFDHYWLTLQQNMLLAALVVGTVLKQLKVRNQKILLHC